MTGDAQVEAQQHPGERGDDSVQNEHEGEPLRGEERPLGGLTP